MIGIGAAVVGGLIAGAVLGPKVKAKVGGTRVGKMFKLGGGCGCGDKGGAAGGCSGGCSCKDAERPPEPIAPLGPPRMQPAQRMQAVQAVEPLQALQAMQAQYQPQPMPAQFQPQGPVGPEFGAGAESVEWCGAGGGCLGKRPKWQ
jgi:hypothetical protein